MISRLDESGSALGIRARALRNVLSNWGTFVLNTVIAFFLAPYVVGVLGAEAYGVWVLVGSLVGYLGLLDVGVRGAVTRYIAKHHAAGEHRDASQIASAGLVLFGAAGLVAISLSAIAGYRLLGYFDIPADLQPVASLVLLISGTNVAVALVAGVFGGVIVGRQRFDVLNAINVAVTLLRASAIVWVLARGAGLIGLASVQLAVSIVSAIAAIVASKRLYPQLRISEPGWGWPQVRTLFAFGATSLLLHASGAVIDYTDSLIIGTALTVAEITPFAIAASLVLYARQVISGISYIVAPMAGALQGSNDRDQVKVVTLLGARFATLAIAPIVTVLILRGGSFIGLWMGPEYGATGGPVLTVLAVYILPFAGFQVLTSAMIGLNAHRGLIPAFVIEAVANVSLSLTLVSTMGLVGVALGTTVPRLVNCLLFAPYYARKMLGISPVTYWKETLVLPTLSIIPFAIATYWVEATWPASGLATFALQLIVTLPLAGLGIWAVALRPDERRGAWVAIVSALGLHR